MTALSVILDATPLSGTVPFTVKFTTTVNGGTTPYTYAWKVNNNDITNTNPTLSWTFTYQKTMTHPVEVIVTDANGLQACSSVNIEATVGGLSVVLSANPTSGTIPFKVNFTTAVTGGTGPYQYAWKVNGNAISDTNATLAWTFSYNQTMIHPVEVTVTDSTGASASDTVDIYATGTTSFTASLNGSPAAGTAPLTVDFTSTVSGGVQPYTYKLDFGDGSSSTASSGSHTYSSNGTYAAKLTVTDSANNTVTSNTVNISVSSTPPPSGITAVVLLVDENTSQAQFEAGAPYLFGLAKEYAYSTNFHGVNTANPGQSLGEYLGMSTGIVFISTDEGVPPPAQQYQGISIAELVEAVGKDWQMVMEDYPGSPTNIWQDGNSGLFVARHCPFLYMFKVSQNKAEWPKCKNYTAPFDPTNLPAYTMVIPNVDDDGHNTNITTADTWAKSNVVPQILGSTEFANGNILLIFVCDNSSSGLGASPCVFIHPKCQGVGPIATQYSHYNVLATIEHILGTGNCGNNDKGAAIMSDMFSGGI